MSDSIKERIAALEWDTLQQMLDEQGYAKVQLSASRLVWRFVFSISGGFRLKSKRVGLYWWRVLISRTATEGTKQEPCDYVGARRGTNFSNE